MRRGELQFLGRLALRLPCSINVRAADVHLCQIGSTSEVSMKNQRLFDTAREIASRDVAQIATLIEKLTRSIATLSMKKNGHRSVMCSTPPIRYWHARWPHGETISGPLSRHWKRWSAAVTTI